MLAEHQSGCVRPGGREPPGRRRDTPSARNGANAARRFSALGEMTGGIAHDFRNILCIIASGLRVVERDADEPARLRAALQATQEGIERGLLMTSRLLAFATHQELDYGPEDVNALLQKLAGFLKFGAGPGIRVVITLADDLPDCLVDPPQFNSAILNLVVNARDAMPDGGVIHISTAAVPADPQSADGQPYVRVRVQDEGVGMAPEVIDRIFDPYFTTKGGNGTGLGVPQVHALMQQVCGHVRIGSKIGAGTSVDLLFPISGRKSPTAELSRHLDRWADGGGAIGATPVDTFPAIGKGETCSRPH